MKNGESQKKELQRNEFFGKDLTRLEQVLLTARRINPNKEFWIKFWAALAHDIDLFEKIVSFVKARWDRVLLEIDSGLPLDHDKRKDGWKLVENNTSAKFGIVFFEKVVVCQTIEFIPKKDNLQENELIARAKEMNCLICQYYAEAILRQQSKIPKDWRKYTLNFPGTVWQDKENRLLMPCLIFSSDSCSLVFRMINDKFDLGDYFVRFCP